MNKVVIFLVILISQIIFIGSSYAAPITGTISLPSGQVAPSGGLRVFITARDLTAGLPNENTFRTISAGQSSVTYTLTDVPNNNTADWLVNYACANTITDGCLEYVTTGFYKLGVAGNVTYDDDDADTIKDGDVANMTLLQGIKMSGSVSLPFGVAPAGGADFRIFVRTDDFSLSFDHIFTIAEGTTSEDFGITVPNDSNLDYIAAYQCPNLPSTDTFCFDNFVRNGAFDSSLPNNTNADISSAELLQGNIARNDINMELLTGTSVSGTVSLPSGNAPSGGIPIRVSATDTENGNLPAFGDFTVVQGTNSVDYSISVADDNMAGWRIAASCNSLVDASLCASLNYFTSFYDASGVNTTTDSVGEADSVAGGQDHANIDITFLTSLSISGLVFLEDGFVAPPGGLTLSVSVQDAAGGGVAIFEDVFIAAGLISAPFNISVPNSSTDWELSYFCPSEISACSEFETFGYYDSDALGTTTNNINQSEVLPGGVNYSGLILTVFSDPSGGDDQNFFIVPTQNGNSVIFGL